MKVAIVHDWLVGGGAEKVILELHKIYPDAPIYTSYCTDEWRKKLDGKVVTGFLQKWPFSKLRKFIPVLRIWWFTHLDFSGYDMVISSSGNGEAKGIRVPEGVKHICYCHAPTHFYWRHYDQYLKSPGFGIFNPLARLGLRILVGPLRRWDKKASQRPDLIIANSSHTQRDIKKYYERDSIVIHPPVDTERFTAGPAAGRSGFITMGRLNPYKRVDLIIEACNRLSLPLRVLGRGPELARLKKLAGPTITFPPYVSDADLPAALAGAEAFIFAAFEDFGIAPVEAMAAGTPVIAYKDGGALDYVIEGQTGTFFTTQTAESLVKTLKKFRNEDYKPTLVAKHAQTFSNADFRKKISEFVSSSRADA
jgi:glycosyltransferase involved in cell wall biosynthesis